MQFSARHGAWGALRAAPPSGATTCCPLCADLRLGACCQSTTMQPQPPLPPLAALPGCNGQCMCEVSQRSMGRGGSKLERKPPPHHQGPRAEIPSKPCQLHSPGRATNPDSAHGPRPGGLLCPGPEDPESGFSENRATGLVLRPSQQPELGYHWCRRLRAWKEEGKALPLPSALEQVLQLGSVLGRMGIGSPRSPVPLAQPASAAQGQQHQILKPRPL